MLDLNLEHVKHFRFTQLFVDDLGWDRPAQQQPYSITIGDEVFALAQVAHKRGVQVLHCRPDAQGRVPAYATRQKIERKVTAEAREHLIVFTDADQKTQVWQWVARLPGKPVQYREVFFRQGESAELLKQKLSRLQFTLDDEALLTVLGVTARLDDALPRDKVTKKFYSEFKKQRDAFEQFIEGIPKLSDDLHWYAAVLIDRLMFIWFLQEKQFLDGKKRYLQDRLAAHGANATVRSFYRQFLCPLFFRGFAEERTDGNRAVIAAEFGQVPYLNGGLFSQHELEQRYGDTLDVADVALEKLFTFFDSWEWHLDDRPLRNDREINPDVLGYIFEKFVNQKQMGAYYTKEDITEYIGKNTIIPALLHKVRSKYPSSFDALVWPLLQAEPDRYIYPAMLKGVEQGYPADIEVGRDNAASDLLARRKRWNDKTPGAWALPTEIWRETIARHDRTRELRAKLAAGDIREIGDLITWNLDIRRFAQDVIERCTDVALLREFWAVLAGRVPRKSGEKFRPALSVLDPTCGSGAFLFAALNILKPLYDAALGTMAGLLLDADQAGDHKSAEKWKDIQETTERFGALRGDRASDYAVIKHIVVHNLYGVDIEEQATEIAKLRLFLKLVSLLEPGDTIEPLPDIDFNIRHGNTLVGYASADETEAAVKGATQGNLFSDAWEDIRIRLVEVEEAYHQFQIQQVQREGHVSVEDKHALTVQLIELDEILNFHLCRAYGKDPTKGKQLEAWKISHKPFHWYVDFYPLMSNGGFDVVIGNPPYIELHKVEGYEPQSSIYSTAACGNLYAPMLERILALCQQSGAGRLGQIVPISCVSTPRMQPLRDCWNRFGTQTWLSHYSGDAHPSVLFNGVKFRLSIVLQQVRGKSTEKIYSTPFQRWFPEARPVLFQQIEYDPVEPSIIRLGLLPKVSHLGQKILKEIGLRRVVVAHSVVASNEYVAFAHRIVAHYVKAFDFLPFFRSERDGEKRSEDYKPFALQTRSELESFTALLNSSLFYLWFVSYSDVYHCGRELILDFPCDVQALSGNSELLLAAEELMRAYRGTAIRRAIKYKTTGLVEYDEFYSRLVKPQIDRVDIALARSFDLSEEQLDFVLNFDVKYRSVADEALDD